MLKFVAGRKSHDSKSWIIEVWRSKSSTRYKYFSLYEINQFKTDTYFQLRQRRERNSKKMCKCCQLWVEKWFHLWRNEIYFFIFKAFMALSNYFQMPRRLVLDVLGGKTWIWWKYWWVLVSLSYLYDVIDNYYCYIRNFMHVDNQQSTIQK